VDPWGTAAGSLDAIAATLGGLQVEVELVGPHLRLGGRISLGRFGRLSDRINHGRGFILMTDARLLKRNGDPTPLVLPEIYVNQDEVTFIAISHAETDPRPATGSGGDRPIIRKDPRPYVVFTPGHSIAGMMHVHTEMSLANFVDAAEPRFIAMTAGTARSLADWRVVSRFDLLLINRTQMTAIAEPGRAAHEPDALAIETG
jgi:hypothetical protein